MLRRLALPSLLLTLAACGGAGSEGPMLRARADSVFQYGLGTVQLYARTEDGSVNPVAPEIPLEGATTSYAVVRDSAGTVLLLIETPTSPREWNNEYRHYFDAAGHTVFFRRYSGFFDGCEWGMAKETLERSYTATFKVARELYSITNDAGSPQDSTRCKFDFHFPYEVFPSWDAAAAALRIPATARQQPA